MTKRLLLPLSLLTALATTACDDAKTEAKPKDEAAAKKDGDAKAAGADKAADGDAAKADSEAPADGGEAAGDSNLIKKSSVEWYKEYMAVKGADAMKYMDKKVELTGKVTKVITEMDESKKLWVEGEGEGWVSLQFTDNGAAVKDKSIAEGAEVTALCDIGGADPGKYVMMTQCELK